MSKASPFKWRRFEAEIVLLCVRRYLRYALSYRDLEEMMAGRRLSIDHTTIYRRVTGGHKSPTERTVLSIIVLHSIRSQKSLPLYQKLGKQP